MENQRIIIADTRQTDLTDALVDHREYLDSGVSLQIGVDIIMVAEDQLAKVAARAKAEINCIGILILREAHSARTSLELEAFFAPTSLPIVEVFPEGLGSHQFIDRPITGRKFIRTFYGRGARGVYWAMHFIKYSRDYPYRTLSYGPDPSQFGDLFLPQEEGLYPVIMLIHGGFWRDAYYRESTHGLAADLAKRGIAAWNIEYRRVGPSGGGYPETNQDIFLALNFLEELANSYPLDLNRVGLAGHSAGGYLSIWGSSIPEDPLKAIIPEARVGVRLGIALAGVTDLDEAYKSGGGDQAATHFLKSAADQPALRLALSAGYLRYAPFTHLVLAHGALDDYVPVALSEYTFQLLQEKGDNAELIIFPDAGHNDFVDPESAVWKELARRIVESLYN